MIFMGTIVRVYGVFVKPNGCYEGAGKN
jgi:hypothetical protein